jgi:small neutral amino acid transporter SnatA (MarC family)
MPSLADSATLLLVLLNPFALSVYLLDLIRTLDPGTFLRVAMRAALILNGWTAWHRGSPEPGGLP